eukprot:TRINITY_DN28729_c0_g1_i4.p1 TRINITY_DN28729_c0_g1~~TRINITY_DN28729_c0_g1_i4.p1  ORF type:complete len:278 (+),score=37.10 TRINITY_DN28729_c0_g1_i4:104-835(+)
MAAGGAVRVRPYQEADREVVHAVFADGILGTTPEFVRLVLRSLAPAIAAAAVAAGTAMRRAGLCMSACIAAPGAAVAALYPLLWAYCHRDALKYVRGARETDLRDIEGHYMRSPRRFFWVAVQDTPDGGERVIGCIALDDKPRPATGGGSGGDEAEPWCELRRMSVCRSARRMGVARRLLSTLEAHARALGFHGVYLSTSTAHKQARAFYRRYGFEQAFTTPFSDPLIRVGVSIHWLELPFNR